MGGGRVVAQVMVEHLLRTKTFAGIARHAFVGSLKQVALFLSDKVTKERVLQNVRNAVHDDTRVVIGHSMGSIVAYEYLCLYQPPSVQMLITLGSPLGIRNLIFDLLTPPPAVGVGIWPGEVPVWVNVADPNDFVALQKELSRLWASPASGRVIIDRQVDNGDKPHYAGRYLNSRQTGAALGGALG
jgi:pimeloyl-ACP methyl ester carboxylesterase